MRIKEFVRRFGDNKLAPGCWIAAEFAERELRGDHFSIEFLRAAAELAPTYPEAWSRQEGADFAAAFCAR